MGTSLIDLGGQGFWARDPLVESLLALLVVELEPEVAAHPWLDPVLDWWTVQAIGGFGGCIAPDLDRQLSAPDRVELVAEAARRIPSRIEGGEIVRVDDPRFSARAGRLWESGAWNRPQCRAPWLRRVADTFVELLDGDLHAPIRWALFVYEDHNAFLDAPPDAGATG